MYALFPRGDILKKSNEKTKYIYAGLTAFAVLAAGMLMIYIIFRKKELAAAVEVVKSILEPFIIGGVLAYLLAPLCNTYERWMNKLLPDKKWKPKLAATLAVAMSSLSAIVVIAVLVLLIVPATLKSLVSLVLSVPGLVMDFINWSNERLADYPQLKKYLMNAVDVVYDKFDSWTQLQLMPSIQTLLSGVGSSISLIFTFALNIVIGFIISIYLLASRKLFARQSKMLLYAVFRPKAADLIFGEVKYADRMFSGFLRGKVLDSAIVGLICFVFLKIMNYEDVMLISVIVGVTNIIPFFGPFIGAIPSALLIFVTSPIKCVYFVIFIFILQQFDGNILGPKCMGSTTKLSAFWILFAILLFGGLMGFVGMIIGVPLFAVIYDIVKKLVYFLLHKHGRDDMLPAETEDTADPPSGTEEQPASAESVQTAQTADNAAPAE